MKLAIFAFSRTLPPDIFLMSVKVSDISKFSRQLVTSHLEFHVIGSSEAALQIDRLNSSVEPGMNRRIAFIQDVPFENLTGATVEG